MTPQLVVSARRLLGAAKRKPSQADLRRTISTAYYAGFDALARLCADEVVGSAPRMRLRPEWSRTYRALNHGRSRAALEELRSEFAAPLLDVGLENFCVTLDAFHVLRLEADYDPSPLRLKRAQVAVLVDEMELAIQGLASASAEQRRRLAFACVLVKRSQR